MQRLRNCWLVALITVVASVLFAAGCANTPVDNVNSDQGPAPLRMPPPEGVEGEYPKSYEDSLTGGQVFKMYCSYCHNSPSLAERSYAQFRNVGAHMRVRANLTGKEYEKLMEFLRRWNNIPHSNPTEEPSPKRFFFSQPIAELQPQAPANPAGPAVLPAPNPVPPPGGK